MFPISETGLVVGESSTIDTLFISVSVAPPPIGARLVKIAQPTLMNLRAINCITRGKSITVDSTMEQTTLTSPTWGVHGHYVCVFGTGRSALCVAHHICLCCLPCVKI